MTDFTRFPIADGVRLIKNVMIPMRDGVRLAADLYAPDPETAARNGWETTPVVMEYIPYRKDEVNPANFPHYLYLPRHGYTVARVDIRGTGASEGHNIDEYTLQEQQDGYDAVEWIAGQPWCDGHVNMMGISYGGFTALQVASHAPPHLTSIIPVDFTDDRYTDDCHYRGGLLRMYYDIGWYGTRMIAWGAMPPDPDWCDDWAEVWEHHLAHNEPYLLKWLAHQTDGDYWRPGSVRDFPERIQCPCFLIGGWRDGYPNPPLRLYHALVETFRRKRSDNVSTERQPPHKVLMGPWNHAWPSHGLPGPRIDFMREVVRWLDHWCRAIDNGIMNEPPVVVFLQHYQPPVVDRLETPGEWRAESSWPPPEAQSQTLHLNPNGLLSETPGPDGGDALDYHPAVGVTGGLWSGGVQFGLPGDQRPDEALSLVYTTAPLADDVYILGWPRAVLHVSSSASVIGFAASLSDVAPDGASHLVAKGMLNATRRESFTDPRPLTPNEVVELDIGIDCIAWKFEKGHRLRLSIANADFPNVWPTPELGRSRVYRGSVHPSRLVLPIVPARGSAAPPTFAPSSATVTRHSAAVHPNTWKVAYDVLTGRATADVRVNASIRVNDTTTIEREFASVCSVDPRDPAHASARGWHECTVTKPNSVTRSRADTVIEATASHFQVTIDLEVRRNGAVHFQKRWAESIPRQWL
jgi:hypothetical protein